MSDGGKSHTEGWESYDFKQGGCERVHGEGGISVKTPRK